MHAFDIAFAAVVIRGTIVPRVLAWWRRRNALVRDAKEDLIALNSHCTFVQTMSALPHLTSHALRKGVAPVPYYSWEGEMRRNHKTFCAKWARAAKGRFDYAADCIETPLNRAALQRWLRAKWLETYPLQFGDREHRIDEYMTDTIDMCFLPTHVFMTSQAKKRKAKKAARMEYYNERKFVEGWK
jgi:hypothetical protein